MTIIWPEHGLRAKAREAPLGWKCSACTRWLPWFLKRCPDWRQHQAMEDLARGAAELLDQPPHRIVATR